MSSFLNAFTYANTKAGEHYYLVGDCMLVEELPKEEIKSKSGLIVAAPAAKQVNSFDATRPVFCRVLAKGQGFYDEKTGETVPLEVEVGDVIVVGYHSVRRISIFGPLLSEGDKQLGLARESEIQIRFKGMEGYKAFCNALEEGSKS